MRPNTGFLWLDIFYLLLVGALQFSIIPSLLGRYVYVDLLTPWLVINFVNQSLARSTVLAVIGALIIETHNAAPAGLFICIYWITLNLIHLVRDTLSWRHATPWIATFVLSELWVVLGEYFLTVIVRGSFEMDMVFYLVTLLRMLLAVGTGLLIVKFWLGFLEE
jgi:hypothetical protein